MANMHPDIQKRSIRENIKEDSEAYVYKKLSELSNEFHVYHSIRYVDFTWSTGKPEGECDFVIVHKSLGLLVLEVKGGIIECKDGNWYSSDGDGTHSVEPYKQARDNIHAIVDEKLQNERSVREKFPYGYAVCFPHCEVPKFSQSLKKSTLESKDTTIGANELSDPEEGIRKIMNRWRGKRDTGKMSRHVFDQISEVLERRFNLVPSLKSELDSLEQHLIALDEQQIEFLRFLDNHRQAAISGPAGSGKTILAVEKARRLADSGNQVLLLTYNRPIAEKLSTELEQNPNIEVNNVHRWGLSLIRKTGVGRDVNALRRDQELGDEFFRKQFPELLLDAIESSWISYDAFILDEGQDFEREVLLPLQAALDEESYFYVFYDSNQDVYNTYEALDLPSPPYPLPYNYRSPGKLVDFASEETRIDVSSAPNRAGGRRPSVIRVEEKHIRDEINRYIAELTGKGLEPGSICIVVQNAKRFISWWGERSVDEYPLEASELPVDSDVVRVVSLKRFKGLECKAAALCDIEGVSSIIDSPKKYYVALTRATFDARVFSC